MHITSAKHPVSPQRWHIHIPSAGTPPCPLSVLLCPRGPCVPLGEPFHHPLVALTPSCGMAAGRDNGHWGKREGCSQPPPAMTNTTEPRQGPQPRNSPTGGSRPSSGAGTQAPGLPFPSRAAAGRLSAVAMVGAPGRLRGGCRHGRGGGGAAPGAAGAAAAPGDGGASPPAPRGLRAAGEGGGAAGMGAAGEGRAGSPQPHWGPFSPMRLPSAPLGSPQPQQTPLRELPGPSPRMWGCRSPAAFPLFLGVSLCPPSPPIFSSPPIFPSPPGFSGE